MGNKFKKIVSTAVFLFAARTVVADPPVYDSKPDQSISYQIIMKAEWPDSVRTTTGYLEFWPQPAADRPEKVYHYRWAIRDVIVQAGANARSYPGDSIDFITAKDPQTRFGDQPDIFVGKQGITAVGGNADDKAQLDYALGPVWKLCLQPLPPLDLGAWKTHGASQLAILTPSDRPATFWGRAAA